MCLEIRHRRKSVSMLLPQQLFPRKIRWSLTVLLRKAITKERKERKRKKKQNKHVNLEKITNFHSN